MCIVCGIHIDHWLAVGGDIVYISHNSSTHVYLLHSVTCSHSSCIVNVCNNTLLHAFNFIGRYIYMINLNVIYIYIYIHNKDLLFKSFCRIINPTLAQEDLSQFVPACFPSQHPPVYQCILNNTSMICMIN